MDTTRFEPDDPASAAAGARRSGRTKRIVTSVAVSAVLLGSGAAIGIAVTGGASASTSGASTGAASTSTTGGGVTSSTAASRAAGRCAKLEQRLRGNGHTRAAAKVRAFCGSALLRLAHVGGEHGEVTFEGKSGRKTIAFERGTIQAVSSSAMTVVANDGTTWTWDFTSSTVVRAAHQKVTSAKLSTGDMVLVGGPVVSGIHDARLIRIRDAG